MARFYFHLNARDRVIPDEEGQDLPSLSAARCEALSSAREILANAIKEGRAAVPDALVIADEDGQVLNTVPLATVLPKALKL